MHATRVMGKGRDIVAYFAGHLAHLINGDDILPSEQRLLEIKPFSLYEKIRRSLAANGRYAKDFVGAWAYGPPHDAAEAADFYFDQVWTARSSFGEASQFGGPFGGLGR